MGGAADQIAGKVTSEQDFERRKAKITGETLQVREDGLYEGTGEEGAEDRQPFGFPGA